MVKIIKSILNLFCSKYEVIELFPDNKIKHEAEYNCGYCGDVC